MVSNDVIMSTVKRMLSSGVDDDTIRMTLKGINLGEEEIDNVINEAKGVSSDSPKTRVDAKTAFENLKKSKEPEIEEGDSADYNGSEDSVDDDSEEDDSEEAVDVKKELEAVSQEQAAQHTTTHQLLDEHREQMQSVQTNVADLHKKFDSSPSLSPETIGKINALDKRMTSLEKEISETKANTIAIQDLLKKILETNKKTLLKLEK
ncbi:MAG: hypothetical protein NUV57_00310 [archaeon]|nr:hypothetical protein [archaeon]